MLSNDNTRLHQLPSINQDGDVPTLSSDLDLRVRLGRIVQGNIRVFRNWEGLSVVGPAVTPEQKTAVISSLRSALNLPNTVELRVTALPNGAEISWTDSNNRSMVFRYERNSDGILKVHLFERDEKVQPTPKLKAPPASSQ